MIQKQNKRYSEDMNWQIKELNADRKGISK